MKILVIEINGFAMKWGWDMISEETKTQREVAIVLHDRRYQGNQNKLLEMKLPKVAKEDKRKGVCFHGATNGIVVAGICKHYEDFANKRKVTVLR